MLGLRPKLLLGLGALLLIVLLASLLSENVMERYSDAIRQSYREDYDSVAACQGMKEAVERMDVIAQAALWDQATSTRTIDSIRNEFEAHLATQRRAATLPGESPATEQLAERWQKYVQLFPGVLDQSVPLSQRRQRYLAGIQPQSEQLRAASQQLIDMNLASILAVPAKAQASARRAHWAMRTLTLSALLLALLFAGLIGRIILGPLRTLTRSVREVEQGNLDLHVPIRSSDELGILGSAFNSMAEKLRQYRQLADDRLMRTERTTQLAIDSLPDAVLVADTGGTIELVNEAGGRLLGLKPGDQVAVSPLPWLADLWRRISDTDHASELNSYESTVQIDVDGMTRSFLPRSVPILNGSRRAIGVTVVLADVTGLRRLDAMKNSLLSLVSHELRTPLTSARMILHLVTEHKVGPLTPKQDELLSAARDDSDRLHQIVESLLDMSRIEAGRALMELRPVRPCELVAPVIASLAGSFQSQEVALHNDVPESLPRVSADMARIGHVFANLLMNSLRYTPAGGSVRIAAQCRGNVIEFTVADTGCGIPQESIHRVFEKFFRVPGQPRGSGSGLGLSIARDIVEAHGGRIRIENQNRTGAVATFTLLVSEPSKSEQSTMTVRNEPMVLNQTNTGDTVLQTRPSTQVD